MKYGVTYADPCYTGGGIYVMVGKTDVEGRWFTGGFDGSGFEPIHIVDSDPTLADWQEEMWYPEWFEKHTIEVLDWTDDCTCKLDTDGYEFYKAALNWVLENKPNTSISNYSIGDIKSYVDFADEELRSISGSPDLYGVRCIGYGKKERPFVLVSEDAESLENNESAIRAVIELITDEQYKDGINTDKLELASTILESFDVRIVVDEDFCEHIEWNPDTDYECCIDTGERVEIVYHIYF